MFSPAGVFSGTSGRQNTTHEWISAKLNCPTRLKVFMGLVIKPREMWAFFIFKTEAMIKPYNNHGMITVLIVNK